MLCIRKHTLFIGCGSFISYIEKQFIIVLRVIIHKHVRASYKLGVKNTEDISEWKLSLQSMDGKRDWEKGYKEMSHNFILGRKRKVEAIRPAEQSGRFSMFSSPSTPHILKSFLLTLRVLGVLWESRMRKFNDSVRGFHVRCWCIKDAQDVRSSNTCAGGFGCEEHSFTEWRVSLNIDVFIALIVCTCGCHQGHQLRVRKQNERRATLDDHNLASHEGDSERTIVQHLDIIITRVGLGGWMCMRSRGSGRLGEEAYSDRQQGAVIWRGLGLVRIRVYSTHLYR